MKSTGLKPKLVYFLARQYEVVMDLLRKNRPKLMKIADQLLDKRVLTQGDLEMIMAE